MSMVLFSIAMMINNIISSTPLCVQFVSLEALMTSLTDLYPAVIRRGRRRELLLLLVCVICFLVGLVMVTPVSDTHGKLLVTRVQTTE